MEYVFGAAVGAALFAFFKFKRYRTSNDLTSMVKKHKKYQDGLSNKNKSLFS